MAIPRGRKFRTNDANRLCNEYPVRRCECAHQHKHPGLLSVRIAATEATLHGDLSLPSDAVGLVVFAPQRDATTLLPLGGGRRQYRPGRGGDRGCGTSVT
jgi:hypothetical protein